MAAIIFLVALFIYFAPAFIANDRGHANAGAIFWLNLLTGWSLLGWIVAFVWAFTGPRRIKIQPTSLVSEPYGLLPPADEKVCPMCAEHVKAAARICRFCGYRFDPVDMKLIEAALYDDKDSNRRQ